MREIAADTIRQTVYDLCLQAGRVLNESIRAALRKARDRELSPAARDTLSLLLQNAELAEARQMAICQDTGMAVVFADVGQEVHITGGLLGDAVEQGVRDAYRDGSFRASVVSPVARVNTGDNTPCILYTNLVPGDKVHITVAPKGFGSENMSAIAMLKPSDGLEGIKQFVVDTVRKAGGNPCPPVIVGVGIGSTFEGCALLAKKALLRPLNERSADPSMADLERELLESVNGLGIGAMGLGGSVTALAVHVNHAPTHIAGMPVAVNMQCHCARHAHREV